MAPFFYCAGNWKLNKGPKATKEFLETLASQAHDEELSRLSLFLPALTLHLVPPSLAVRGLNWGAQNVYWEQEGAFTGENSPVVLKELGATHCLVGHSERRSLFSESNLDTQKKMQALARTQITPILCLGETLEQRKSGETNAVICTQLEDALKNWSASDSFWLAYEPVWAIGTGEVATPQQAEDAHRALKDKLKSLLPTVSSRVPILYGGSVKPENAEELGRMPSVNGFLVGGASLKVPSFLEILRQGLKGKGIESCNLSGSAS